MHSQCDRGLSHRCIGQEVPCNWFHPQNQHNDRREKTHVQQNPAGNIGVLKGKRQNSAICDVFNDGYS